MGNEEKTAQQLADDNASLRAQLEDENATLQKQVNESRAAHPDDNRLDDEAIRRIEHPEEFAHENRKAKSTS